MKKILLIILSINLSFASLEDYNVGTWNLQGSSASTESKWNISIRQLVTGSNPMDVLAVQEAGVLPSTATMTQRQVQPVGVGIPIHEYEWNLGTSSRPNSVFIYYSRVDVGANRVNMAIVSRRQADEVIVLPPPTVASRPIIGIRICNDVFFNAHALARGGNDAGAIVTAVDMHFRNMPLINWMILGDFNRDPNSLMSLLDQGLRNRVHFVSPASYTQASGGVLDYAVTGNSDTTRRYTPPAILAILAAAGLRTFLASDHFPVNFRKFF
ncbi:cytolethal distending toxin subunit B family protein [Campylobacter jejuni]|uniref:cytolethal distending toxin subunit B family protein n=1 Tax=Campylobacter jejuni TaxID=197 RepID=UPI0008742DBA|nr:cytolethal distending toxin subunit B family protein [Campylobacter jejuni]EAI4690940.1 cytolethal distending toxin subunit B family protein [Campylobacter jejuni]EAI4692059.1 cytolethal distending toxin subunit B family protein [Campylobacter jejuni]EAK7841273.1 cytolethal distending toxin subunit B family protein [Campylobacter jejuni]EAK7842464.1 cytolethal distending toxin subunit B family protein [Campylobacter jejuni]ECP7644005.1 cytolethal distending toxin subunit B family protein [C